MKKNLPETYLLICSVVLVIAFLLGSFVYWQNWFQLRQRVPKLVPSFFPGERLSKAKEKDVYLSFKPSLAELNVGEEAQIQVMIDSLGKEVWGADLKILFNPQNLKVKQVSPGDYFNEPIVLEKIINQEKGTLSFSIGSLITGKGKGVMAVLKVEPQAEGRTSFNFSSDTQVALRGREDPIETGYQDLSLPINSPAE